MIPQFGATCYLLLALPLMLILVPIACSYGPLATFKNKSGAFHFNFNEMNELLLVPQDSTERPDCYGYAFFAYTFNLSSALSASSEPSDFSCEFVLDSFFYMSHHHGILSPETFQTTWTCDLDETYICNGFSECATDECSCGIDKNNIGYVLDVFYCIDNM